LLYAQLLPGSNTNDGSSRPIQATISSRDRATFATLYHSPVSVGLPAGR